MDVLEDLLRLWLDAEIVTFLTFETQQCYCLRSGGLSRWSDRQQTTSVFTEQNRETKTTLS